MSNSPPTPLVNCSAKTSSANDVENLQDNEPTSDARTCVLYAEDDPEIELVRITADANTDKWSNVVIYNQLLMTVGDDLVDALGENLDDAVLGGEAFGFSAIQLIQRNASITVEARTQVTGVDYRAAPPETLALIAQLAARQLTSDGPGQGSSAIATCDDLAPSAFTPFVDGNLGPFIGIEFPGSPHVHGNNCAGQHRPSADHRVRRSGLRNVASEHRCRQLPTGYRELRAVQADTEADMAWVVDRLFDDDPSAIAQSTLYQGFGAANGVFARVGFRVDTKVERLADASVSEALAAVLQGESPTEPSKDVGVIVLDGPVGEFVATGAEIQVAPLSRGVAACDDLDLGPFETITGVDLVAQETSGSESGQGSVSCDLVRAGDDASDEVEVELRVAAASSADGELLWANAIDTDSLIAVEGIDDEAFWTRAPTTCSSCTSSKPTPACTSS